MTVTLPFFAAAFYAGFFLVVFVWPSVRIYLQTGVNPVTFGNTDNAHDFIGRWFKVLMVGFGVVIACVCVDENAYQYLLPVTYLQLPVMQLAGVVFCLASLAWISVAQWQMGTSWRIGIDEKHPTALRTNGLFAVSRNPIFLGLMTALLGYFFLLPNAITLLFVVTAYLLMQIVVRLEEAFLLLQHGALYQQYKSTVRRWI